MAIFTAIGTAIAGALFAGSTLAATLIGGALAFGTKLALSYLNRPKKRSYSAVQGETQYGGDVPASTIYGVGKTQGHRLFYAKYGKGNRWNAEVFRLAHGWCDGLEPYIYFYGEKHDLIAQPVTGNEAASYRVDGFSGDIRIRFYDGRPGQGVDTILVNNTAGLSQKWKTTSVCAGLCYVVVERSWSEDRFSKGKPTFDFVLRGLREYDPRKDSTVAGGSGPQRRNDSATYVFTKNPGVHRFNYQLGLRGLISNRVIIGEGKSIGQLDLPTYVAAMNVCDLVKNGHATYECGIIVSSDDDHTEILKEFDDAMAGYALNRRGLSGVIPGAPQIPVLEITRDDLDAGRSQTVQKRKSAFDLYNYLSGQFTSIESQWQPESLKPIYVNADVAADGRARQTSNDFLQVTNPDIAQYLLNIRYRQNRKGGSATLPVSRRVGLAVQEGEWVTFDGKEWLVTNWQCDEEFRFTLTLAETSADIYSEAGIVPGPVIVPVLPGVSEYQSELENYQLSQAVIQSETGSRRPALRAIWNVISDPTIISVEFEHRPKDQAASVQVESIAADQTAITLTKGMVSVTDWEVRYRLRARPDRAIPWTAWQQIKTPSAKLGPDDVLMDALAIPPEIYAVAKANWQAVQDAWDEIERLNSLVSGQDAYNFRDKQQMRFEIKVQSDQLSASFLDVITVAIGGVDIPALANRTTALEAKVGNTNIASALSALDTRVTSAEQGLTSQASSLTAVEAKADQASGSGLMRLVASAGVGGVTTSLSFQARATTAAGWAEAGFFLQAMSDGTSRAVIQAAKTYFIDNSGNVAALFANGGAYFNTAYIQNLTAASITLNGITYDRLAPGAITSKDGITGSGSGVTSGNTWVNMATVTIFNPDTQPVLIDWTLTTVLQKSGGQGDATSGTRLLCVTTGEVLALNTYTAPSNTTGTVNDTKTGFILHSAAPQGNVQYAIQRVGSGNANTLSGSGVVRLAWWKR
ncbi:phage tail protein [Mesorhizobium sp. RP14(2022)]|uniref:Phage tail protein n=1 Tax=Mesorhizobium liriopis TaxID=2953882 RepID=A0ABT1C7N1_9HYPH|nr:phage tail protein [Mesorhizobium liriopis]MCO6050831.1 phage tail protein [Mesorhizobium liriopis]